jgi:hypothetical protein
VRFRLAILTAFVAAGCTLLSGAGDLGVGIEGTPEEASAPDALADAAPEDATAPGDAAREDAPPVGPFCSTLSPAPYLCHDFETVGLPGPWNEVYLRRTATLTVEDGGYASARAALLDLPGIVGGGGDTAASLRRRLVGSPAKITVSLSVLVEARGETEFDLVILSAAGGYNLSFEIIGATGALRFDEDVPLPDGGETQKPTSTTGTLPLGTWTPLRLVVDNNGLSAAAELFVNGASVGSALSPAPQCFGPNADVNIGDDAMDARPADWRVRVDDVVIQVQ